MTKLTMTEFKTLSLDKQYSAYDDAINLAVNHQAANEDFATRINAAEEAAKDASEKASAELQSVVAPLNAKIAELESSLAERVTANKAINDQLSAVAKDLADERAKNQNMEGHPDVIAARKQKAIEAAEAKRRGGISAKEQADKELVDLGVRTEAIEVMPAVIAPDVRM